jgi:hypothetical protein
MTTRSSYHSVLQRLATSRSHDPPTAISSLSTWTDSLVGNDMPNWRSVARVGGNATNNMSASRVTILFQKAGNCRVDYYRNIGGDPKTEAYTIKSGMIPGCVNVPLGGSGANTLTADNNALVQILRNVRSQRTQMGGMVFLGELGEALRMIRSPAMAFRRGLDQYVADVSRRGRRIVNSPGNSGLSANSRRRRRRALTEMVSGTYLEYTFGWQPLLNDTKDIALTIARLIRDNDRRTHLRGHGTVEAFSDEYYPNLDAGDQVAYDVTVRNHQTVRVVYRCGYRNVLVTAPQTQRLAELAGIQLSEIVPTIWELIPYSFIVDYFTNVGDILQSACTEQSMVSWVNKTQIDTWRREQRTAVNHARIRQIIGGNYISSTGLHLGLGIVEKKTVTRSSLVSLPQAPVLEFTLPGTHQTWNLAALFTAAGNVRNNFRR